VSERHRTQRQNLDDCFEKLHEMLKRAAEVPKETSKETRERVVSLQHKETENRMREKRERQGVKSQRRQRDSGGGDD